MTEGQGSYAKLLKSLEKAIIRTEMTADGRYIPYSGGMMGWYENGGVMKCEKQNNYLFHTMIDTEALRKKLFERWGEDEKVNRRISKRHEISKPINLSLLLGEEDLRAVTKDYSTHGLRLQVMQEVVRMKKGDKPMTRIFGDKTGDEPLFNLESVIMWINRVGRRRPVWNLGLGFTEMTQDLAKQLEDYFLAQ